MKNDVLVWVINKLNETSSDEHHQACLLRQAYDSFMAKEVLDNTDHKSDTELLREPKLSHEFLQFAVKHCRNLDNLDLLLAD